MIETDYLVLGSGIAGLTFALEAAERSRRVLVVTKRAPDESNTNYAQGGIAAVLDPADTFEAHVADTLTVGEGLCHRDIVELTVKEGPAAVRRLVGRYGARFDSRNGVLDLAREGGHSARRVAHTKDTTGHEIQRALLDAAKRSPNITLLEDHMGVDLLQMAKYGGPDACFGAYVLDVRTSEVKTVVARVTVLATGGAGKIYRYTTNPDVATADGIAMAYRAGAAVGNMEFFQFHPTCLYHPQAKSFLISEALRGEGGILRLRSGEAFMDRYHAMKSLAPRDVVARAIDSELKRSGEDYVVLDMTHLDPRFLVERFPAIFERCLTFGIDLRRDPIPVVPAAHYSCGGVATDAQGRTTLRNLYAVGEVAMTGLHGACRLASNSLLEGCVFGHLAAVDAEQAEWQRPAHVAPWYAGAASASDEVVVITQNWDEVRSLMWNYVGIVRTDRRLERARRRIELIRSEIREYYWNFRVTSDLLELRNLALAAHLVIESARRRKESRGLHFNADYPNKDPRFVGDTILRRGDGPEPT